MEEKGVLWNDLISGWRQKIVPLRTSQDFVIDSSGVEMAVLD